MPNYSFLKTDLINTAENDSTEFANQIPKFVEKAEDRLVKELDDPGLDNFASFTFTASSPTVSLPVDSLVVRNVSFTTSTSSLITPLLQRTYEYAIDYWPYASASVGTPRYYSRKNNTSIYIVPTPTSALTGEIQYTRRPIPLSSATGTSATTSNYFSEFTYNALFNACMVEASKFTKSWDIVQVWESSYTNSVDALRNQARRMRQDDMENPRNPVGGPDTVLQGAQ
tara:strand:+ start:51 stop:731 length:681 start_codon:yes stop_codon:yes gene_type:complete